MKAHLQMQTCNVFKNVHIHWAKWFQADGSITFLKPYPLRADIVHPKQKANLIWYFYH